MKVGVYSVVAVVAMVLSYAEADVAERAVYEAEVAAGAHPMQVRTVEIAVESRLDGIRWYRLICTKVNGDSYTIWLRCEGDPCGASRRNAHFLRYILQEGKSAPVEYVCKRTGEAMLPAWGFAENLLPWGQSPEGRLLFERGKYLGRSLIRKRSLSAEKIEPPKDVTQLVLDSELVIGTSRKFRDDGRGRRSKKDDYNYVRFTRDDYEEMIPAGINYFTVDGEQAEWIWRRPVFYDGRGGGVKFPEELYRSNFLGRSMFIDEPACRLAGKYPEKADTSVAVEMISEYIRNKQSRDYYRFDLLKAGIDLGDMRLVEPVPIWETYVGTSYYQLEVNPYGFVQECRWKIDPEHDTEQLCMLQRLNADYGVNIPLTPRNLFLWFYSQMTGPARIFGSKWGMSIYGQAEPELRLPSMQLAYDMGATYIWFWTSDHSHHVPYTEQLDLARAIRKYQEEHPRGSLEKLVSEADTVIVLPYGYTLPSIWQLYMWGTHLYATDRRNELGKTYKEVLKVAIEQIGECLANDVRYDVVPAGEHFDPSVYKRVVRVSQDATVAIIENTCAVKGTDE